MTVRRHSHGSRRDSFPAPPMPGIFKKIAYSFVALTIIVVCAALWFSSVRATVWVSVTRETDTIQTEVNLAREPGRDELAGRTVQGVFEGSKEFEVTGDAGTAVPGTAKGRVRIFNTSSGPQPLVKITRLLTKDGRLYRLSEGVVVPAKGSVEAEAYADEDGKTYDFTEKTSFSIPGLSESMQKFVYAESISEFTGGERLVRTLTQENVESAEASLRDSILEEAKKKLRAEVQDQRFSESVYLVNLVEKNMDAEFGQETDRFSLSLKLNIAGVFYPKADMDALARKAIQERVPEGKEIVGKEPTKVTYEIDQVDAGKERARMLIRAEVLTKKTSVENLVSKESIAGLPIDEAVGVVERMDGVESAEIIVRPSWVRRLPTLKDRISVKVR